MYAVLRELRSAVSSWASSSTSPFDKVCLRSGERWDMVQKYEKGNYSEQIGRGQTQSYRITT